MVGLRSIGPEITDELLKVLRKRLDETTLDIITVMLVRNCKLTPADVEVTQHLTLFTMAFSFSELFWQFFSYRKAQQHPCERKLRKNNLYAF